MATAGAVLSLAGTAHILYAVAASLTTGWGGEDAPFPKVSAFLGVLEIVLVVGILFHRRWARVLGLTISLLGIGGALVGIFVHGLTVARDEGSGYLMLGFLVSYGYVAAVLAVNAPTFSRD